MADRPRPPGKHAAPVPHGGRTAAAAPRSDGTQAIRRAAGLLHALSRAGPEGASLAELARAKGIARPTAHRILRCLVEERLLAGPDADKRYRMGELVHELSLAPSASGLEVAHWRPVVAEVAHRTGATAYLMRRSGLEAVCVAKADSRAVVRFVPVEVGQRRLLGVGAGATALLAALDEAQREQVIDTILPWLRAYPRLTAEHLRRVTRLAARTGVSMSQGVVAPGGFGLGVAVPSSAGTPHLALSIAEHASAVTESLVADWTAVLREEAAAGAAVAAGDERTDATKVSRSRTRTSPAAGSPGRPS